MVLTLEALGACQIGLATCRPKWLQVLFSSHDAHSAGLRRGVFTYVRWSHRTSATL